MVSHRHTVGFGKLREELKAQTELATERGLEIENVVSLF